MNNQYITANPTRATVKESCRGCLWPYQIRQLRGSNNELTMQGHGQKGGRLLQRPTESQIGNTEHKYITKNDCSDVVGKFLLTALLPGMSCYASSDMQRKRELYRLGYTQHSSHWRSKIFDTVLNLLTSKHINNQCKCWEI